MTRGSVDLDDSVRRVCVCVCVHLIGPRCSLYQSVSHGGRARSRRRRRRRRLDGVSLRGKTASRRRRPNCPVPLALELLLRPDDAVAERRLGFLA